MNKSAEGGFNSIGNTMRVQRNPPENREQLQKFPLNLKFLYATRWFCKHLALDGLFVKKNSGQNKAFFQYEIVFIIFNSHS